MLLCSGVEQYLFDTFVLGTLVLGGGLRHRLATALTCTARRTLGTSTLSEERQTSRNQISPKRGKALGNSKVSSRFGNMHVCETPLEPLEK
eukprot:2017619-Amphidinium_carterae.1